jgi:hypothetical protein
MTLGHAKLHVTSPERQLWRQNEPKPSRINVREHRRRLRDQGLRPIQIWAPDVRSSAVRKEAHRQSAALAARVRAVDDQSFIDAVSDRGDE